jgi:hypothetical protein
MMSPVRGIFVALCVMHLIAVSVSEDVVALDSDETQSVVLGEGSTLNPKAPAVKDRYVSLRSDDWDDDAEAEADYFVRHLGTNVVLTTLGGPIDKRNGAWVVKSPLCQPGFGDCPAQPEGTTSCISLEAADDTNYFLAKHPKLDEVGMRRFPFVDVAAGTFCVHPGHADPTHISLESLAKPGFFVTHKDFKLALCNNEESTPCGKSDRFNSQSTFTEQPAQFFGSCEYKFKDGKKYGRPKCTCIEDVVGKNCDVVCPGGCGENGECSQKEGAEAYCKCTKGHVGNQCQMACPVNEVTGTSCGGRGECTLVDGKPTCECTDGYRGDACQFHCPGFEEPGGICGGKGTCKLVANPAPNEPPTQCDCEPGFLGGSCAIRCPVDAVNKKVCSANGDCALNRETSQGQCNCNNGFAGATCEFSCQTDLRGQVCSGHGECAVQQGDVGGAMCACEPGFSGPACEAGCPGMLAGTPCSGHGRCSFVGDAASAPASATEDTVEQVDDEPKAEQEDAAEEPKAEEEDAADKAKAEQEDAADEAKVKENEAEAEAEGETPASRKLFAAAVAQASKRAVCTCDEGFGSDDCGVACPRDENGSVCTGHGKCNSQGHPPTL